MWELTQCCILLMKMKALVFKDPKQPLDLGCSKPDVSLVQRSWDHFHVGTKHWAFHSFGYLHPRPKITTGESTQEEWTFRHCWTPQKTLVKKHSGTHLWSALCPTLHGAKVPHFSQEIEQSGVEVTESINSSHNSEVIHQVQDPSRDFHHEHQETGLGTGLKTSYSACPRGPSRKQATCNICPRSIQVTGPYTGMETRIPTTGVQCSYRDRTGKRYTYKMALCPHDADVQSVSYIF